MNEYKALAASDFPSPEQLEAFSIDGWEFLQLVANKADNGYILYLRKEKRH